jgi:hypothetical protein
MTVSGVRQGYLEVTSPDDAGVALFKHDEVLEKLAQFGDKTAPAGEPAGESTPQVPTDRVGLIGCSWVDEGGTKWTVTGPDATRPGYLLANSNDTEDPGLISLPVADLVELLSDDPEAFTGVTWTDPADGTTWTITGKAPDDPGCVTASNAEGFEAVYLLDEIIEVLHPTPAEETVGTLSETVGTVSSEPKEAVDEKPDTSLAGAGAEADEQYRMRHLDGDQSKPQVMAIEELRQGRILELINKDLRALQAGVIAEDGPGTLTISIKVKPLGSAELDYEVTIKPAPPKVKIGGKFFPNGEIVQGLPKREHANQLTINDAEDEADLDDVEIGPDAKDLAEVDNEPGGDAPISERIAADESADPGDAPDANPWPDGHDLAERQGLTPPAETPEGIEDSDDEIPPEIAGGGIDDSEVVA